MSSARDEILGKIRGSVATSPPALDYASSSREYQQSGTLMQKTASLYSKSVFATTTQRYIVASTRN